jgi:hypothetical protein
MGMKLCECGAWLTVSGDRFDSEPFLGEPVHVFCDICGEHEHPADLTPDWNGGTGCHLSCEREEWDYDPSDSYLLRDSESTGSGGARDSSASYRSEMRDAGRGGLLR